MNYRITIQGNNNHGNIVTKVYETIADLSSNLRGRATRVYEAHDIGNQGAKVVIKDSWVDANCPNEADTLGEMLDVASEDEKAMFLTVLLHGVVTIDGRQDITQDFLMDGYLISNDDNSIKKKRKKLDGIVDRLAEKMVNVHIADRGAKDILQSDHMYKVSILSSSKYRTLTLSRLS
ncbi:hypothetical protein BYT27DRAFT_6436016 [Phlegmacium glaucopus]|nr:hypothetical protein BYT27DRAFT_6436016 [Phlegmacium glaucopus]